MSILNEILDNKAKYHYVLPFTRLYATDTKNDIKERLLSLKKQGIYSMTIWFTRSKEDNVPSFNSEVYWERIKWVAEICREENMTFLIQDTPSPPTGWVDGLYATEEYRHLDKLYLAEDHIDAYGPDKDAAFFIDAHLHKVTGTTPSTFRKDTPLDEKLISVSAVKQDENGKFIGEPIDLTEKVQNGMLYWAVPEGIWRIFIVKQTHNGGYSSFMNILDKDSIGLLIEKTYKPHYEHLKDEVGKTWLGMFYDEPEVGNVGGYDFLATIGKPIGGNKSVVLPWCEQMNSWGKENRAKLSMLWYDIGENFAAIRYGYMNAVSKLIRDNYNGQMYKWCKERGLIYTGHVLEDENSHCRLSTGPVHFFRTEEHQSWAGIDEIGGQIMPYKDGPNTWYGHHYGDGLFYHYGMGKLASSAARISPEKNFKSLCEGFGVRDNQNFEKYRKFVADHLMVNGINHLVMGSIDNSNYAAKPVFDYSNRVCHLLNNTKPIIKTAILYHGDCEWFDATTQGFQFPASRLARNQISYDCVPADVFEYPENFLTETENGLTVNGNKYEAFIIPSTTALPKSVISFIEKAKQTGFPVFYIEKCPTYIAESGEKIALDYGEVALLDDIAQKVSEVIERDLLVSEYHKWLRYSHIFDTTGDYYYLHNEGEEFTTRCRIKANLPIYYINMLDLKVYKMPAKQVGDYCEFDITLAEFESAFFYSGQNTLTANKLPTIKDTALLEADWQVNLLGETKESFNLSNLCPITAPDMYPNYCGKVEYTTSVDISEIPDQINLGKVNESCELYLNGKLVGAKISAPYIFNIKEFCVMGKNEIKIIVDCHYSHQKISNYSTVWGSLGATIFSSLRPAGLLGPVNFIYNK